ncbi:hypothetical protein HDU83_008597 [Entophlyctis luteolus]|nr:hypothetical protein HDU82_001623 [Entophlyctis luteolus]KAJ3357090.1 hypothetical protein HDU83_008597 [Entophlyctis luteolus]KAJ3392037.1 hypothetical protein HDU84_004965 [Entophlyctis sp. JEL0112]
MRGLTLDRLPSETLVAILAHVSFTSVIAFRLVCRRFHCLVESNGDPLGRFRRFDSPDAFLESIPEITGKLINRVIANNIRPLDLVPFGQIWETRHRQLLAQSVRSTKLDGMIIEVSVKSKHGSVFQNGLIGVARVLISVAANFGFEGGVQVMMNMHPDQQTGGYRIHVKSCFLMSPIESLHHLAEVFCVWNPGYVTLLAPTLRNRGSLGTSPLESRLSSPLGSLVSGGSSYPSPPMNTETRPLFPRSISRSTGYFGDPGMRYIPCETVEMATAALERLFLEDDDGVVIEFLADGDIGYGGDDSGFDDADEIPPRCWESTSPPHDLSVAKIADIKQDLYQVVGGERGSVCVCVVSGSNERERANRVLETSSYLKMLGKRWIELYGPLNTK